MFCQLHNFWSFYSTRCSYTTSCIFCSYSAEDFLRPYSPGKCLACIMVQYSPVRIVLINRLLSDFFFFFCITVPVFAFFLFSERIFSVVIFKIGFSFPSRRCEDYEYFRKLYLFLVLWWSFAIETRLFNLFCTHICN